jgi:hypothetical protein
MTLERLYNISMAVQPTSRAEITLYLTKEDHEKLQKEVYKMKDPTLSSYKSQSVFQVQLSSVKFILKII